jgi:hypothetical protein
MQRFFNINIRSKVEFYPEKGNNLFFIMHSWMGITNVFFKKELNCAVLHYWLISFSSIKEELNQA